MVIDALFVFELNQGTHCLTQTGLGMMHSYRPFPPVYMSVVFIDNHLLDIHQSSTALEKNIRPCDEGNDLTGRVYADTLFHTRVSFNGHIRRRLKVGFSASVTSVDTEAR